MRNWWIHSLTATDKLNIICFAIVMLISGVCILVAKKMKLPIWKFQIGWILFMDILAVVLLIARLTHG